MSFRPYTYARTQQFLPPLWAAIKSEVNELKKSIEFTEEVLEEKVQNVQGKLVA